MITRLGNLFGDFSRKVARMLRSPKSEFKPQSLLFDAKRYTPFEAMRWARAHGYRVVTPEIRPGGKYLRIRQIDPGRIIPGTWATVTFGKGIKATFGRLRRSACVSRAA